MNGSCRTARRLLQERASTDDMGPALMQLQEILKKNASTQARLRALWTIHAIQGHGWADVPLWLDADQHIRAWVVRLCLEKPLPDPDFRPGASLSELLTVMTDDRSPIVRLEVATALARLDFKTRQNVAYGLSVHEKDATDPYLALMIWYGLEPVVGDSAAAGKWLFESKIPLLRELQARKVTSLGVDKAGFQEVVTNLGKYDSPPVQRDVLRGIVEGLRDAATWTCPANGKGFIQS